MKQRNFNAATGTMLIFAATLHSSRLVFNWDLALDSYVVPKFISLLLAIVAFYLAIHAFRLGK